MPQREYCCCAIPLVNAGVYVALVEQFTAGLVAGIVSVATPSIVGAATPSFASWIFAVVCFVAAGLQVLGIFGVAKDKPILFRRYLSLHCLVALAAFAVGAAWAIISAARHSTAQDRCLKEFFDTSDSAQAAEGQTMCNIFPWVDVGIMGGLWVLLAIMHIYLYVVLSSYSRAQQRDFDRSKYDALGATTDNIPMNDRSQAWDNQDVTNNEYHRRQESTTSMSDVMTLPVHKVEDSYNYRYQQQPYVPQQAYPTTRDVPKFGDPTSGYGGSQRI